MQKRRSHLKSDTVFVINKNALSPSTYTIILWQNKWQNLLDAFVELLRCYSLLLFLSHQSFHCFYVITIIPMLTRESKREKESERHSHVCVFIMSYFLKSNYFIVLFRMSGMACGSYFVVCEDDATKFIMSALKWSSFIFWSKRVSRNRIPPNLLTFKETAFVSEKCKIDLTMLITFFRRVFFRLVHNQCDKRKIVQRNFRGRRARIVDK